MSEDELEKLRDSFAMAALPAIITDNGQRGIGGTMAATQAYEFADAMLDARQKERE